MRSLHVLLIAESFPPSAYVGSIRPGAVVRALIRAGHRATVIRSAAYAAAGRPPMDGEGIRVLTVTARENPIRILARLNPFRGGGRATAGAPGNRSVDARETILGRVRRWVLSLGLLPDDSQGFIPAAVLAALDHHRGDRFDLLMTTAPPFSDHLIGVLLSRLLGVPWVAEFRDPWLPRSSQAPARSAVVDWLEQRLEDQVLRQCDLIVAVTPSAGLALDRKRLALGKPGGTLVAMNGIPALLPESPRPTDGPLEVLHAGVLYLGRDPRPFLRAVAAGVRAGRFGPAGVRIRFMGSSGGEFEGQSVAQMADALGIGDCVEILGQRPIEECRKMMAQADALLLLAQAQPTQIPNKLYDYVATRRPIIGYVDAQGESAVLLHGVGGHHLVCDSDPGHDEAVVEALLASRQAAAGAGMDSNQLSSLLTEVQLAPLVESLERLAAPADSARGFRVPPARPISAAAAGAARHPRPDSVVSGAADASVAVNLAVSVVIPAWNVAEHIGEAVRSVLAQTFRNWELIVINDGSPDTAALERALAPYRDRLTYLVQENRGPGEARNTGLAAARGTWIAFLDGDDVGCQDISTISSASWNLWSWTWFMPTPR
ncbi:MAG: glycosyltransferase [Gemmatimonadota bacterium]|nr:glycosyltransferase [Gemmatimonadota bacterium]